QYENGPALLASPVYMGGTASVPSHFFHLHLRGQKNSPRRLNSTFRRRARARVRVRARARNLVLAFVVVLCALATDIVHAGDILRGGATFSAPAPATANAASGSTATVAKLRAHGQDILSTTTRALQAVQAMQNAARNLAT